MAKKSKYQYLCEVCEELNEMAKYEGSSDRYVVIQTNPKDKRTLRIVCLRVVNKENQ